MRKKYTLINYHAFAMLLSITKERSELIQFNGGNRVTKSKGYFITEDPVIQEALEKDKAFNDIYYLESVVGVSNAKRTDIPETRVHGEVASPQTEATDTDHPIPEEVAETETPETETPEADTPNAGNPSEDSGNVTNYASAKSYLMKAFPDDKTLLSSMNKANLLDYAKGKGVQFPNWA